MFKYKVFSFGGTNPYQNDLCERLKEKFGYSLLSNKQYEITSNLHSIQLGKEPTVALYWADENKSDEHTLEIQKLEEASVPIIPIISDMTKAKKLLPSSLSKINAAELEYRESKNQIETITNFALKFLGLLYKEKNIFISYKRTESENVAKQIHAELTNRGFNAFLDKIDVPIGVDFQDLLKHKLSDCSVLLLLDTQNFFESHWTKEEYRTAQNLRIGILNIRWPDVKPSREYNFNDTCMLSYNDFDKSENLILRDVRCIANKINSLSARYYESRRQGIIGNFINDIKDYGFKPIQNIDGTISIDGKNLLIVPLIGVPQSWDYYKIDNHTNKNKHIFLLYDNQCILDDWMEHLKWIECLSDIQPIYINDDTSWIQQNL